MWIARKKTGGKDRKAGIAAKSRRARFVSPWGLALLLAPGLVWALITGTWTISGSSSASTAVNGITVTFTGTSDGNYANGTFNTTNYWTDPYGSTVNGGTSLTLSIFGDTTTRTYTVTFSKPVNNPVLHVDRLGGYSSGPNSSIWTLNAYAAQSGTVSMTRLGGNTQFVMPTATSFQRSTTGTASSTTAECTTASGNSSSGTACGSIRFNGTGITSLTFRVAMSSNVGNGDELEMRWSFQGSNVIVKKQSNGATGTFGFTNGGGLSSATYNLNTATANPATSSTYGVTNHAAAITVTESTLATGFILASASCVDQNGNTVTSTLNTGTRALSIAANAYNGNQTITCTFVNNRNTATIRLQKSLPDGRAVAADQFTLGMTGTGAPASVTTTGSGSTATGTLTHSSATAGSAYTLSETGAAGANLANYTTTYACTNALSGGQTPSGSGASFSVTPVAGDDLTCTFANTPKTVQFRLAKAWGANAIAGNVASIGATTGLTANTAAFTSTASTASQSAYVTAIAGQTATLPAETFATGNAANYTTTLACDNGVTPSGTNGQQANTVVIPNNLAAGTQVTCTYTNTRRAATLTLRKQWANAAVGDDATLTVSRGAAQLRSFVSDAGSASELDVDATPVNVNAGDVLTLAETLAGGNAGLYDGTLACTGTSGLSGTTLTVAAADTAIVCTWTNARRQADLSIAKTNNVASVVSGTPTTYTVTVTNNGPTAVTGAVLTDTPSPGLTCPAGNIITCSGSGCPASPNPITMGDVSSGLALGTLAATAPGNTVVLTGTCTVD